MLPLEQAAVGEAIWKGAADVGDGIDWLAKHARLAHGIFRKPRYLDVRHLSTRWRSLPIGITRVTLRKTYSEKQLPLPGDLREAVPSVLRSVTRSNKALDLERLRRESALSAILS